MVLIRFKDPLEQQLTYLQKFEINFSDCGQVNFMYIFCFFLCYKQMSKRLFLWAVLLIVVGASFNETISKELAVYSRIATCDNKSILEWSCGLCRQVPQLENTLLFGDELLDVQGYVGYSKSLDRILLVFRSTKTNINFATDLLAFRVDFSPKNCKGCSVHSGFYSAYKSVASQVDHNVRTLSIKYSQAKVIATGHSLGGALATIAALDLQEKYNFISDMYNFGTPRVGDKDFQKQFDKKIPQAYRIVHNRDLVPHVPPSFFGYRHVGQQIFYNDDMSAYKTCQHGKEDKTCSDSINPAFYSVDDHRSGYWNGVC